jgi:aspartate oxidase
MTSKTRPQADEPAAPGADSGDRGSLTPNSGDQRSRLSHSTRTRAVRDIAPGLWRREADVVVVGSGAAGISVALTAAARGLRVLVVTKDLVGGATPMAQGGLAAALGAGDSPAAHVADTLVAGAGLCSPDTVTALAESAPGAIGWLTGLGAQLETRDLRLEGGHSARRIVHSGDDATGAEVHRTLLSALLASGIEIVDRTVALDLLRAPAAPESFRAAADTSSGGNATTPMDDATAPGEVDGLGGVDGAGTSAGARVSGRAAAANASPVGALARELVPARLTGLLAGAIGADGRLTPGVITAQAVVIAAGGLGQAFGTTSNPAGATGDGIAIAARAGAVIRDLEFVQFHPTVLWLPEASGQCPLITEALRGAGAVLRDLDGTPLMAGHDPRGDLAPRDVVAARMAEVIAAGDAGHVWLDATGLGRDLLENGFPTVTAACRKHGIDPVTAMIPVAPGAHYSCGGIRADLDGRTTIPGLYAVGEAASTGIQGANRLASNSVTEAIIAGRRTGTALADACSTQGQNPSAMTAWSTTSNWHPNHPEPEYPATVPPEATNVLAPRHTRPGNPSPTTSGTADVPALWHTRPEYSSPVAHTDASSGLEALGASSFWSWGTHGQKESGADPAGNRALASESRGAVGRGELTRAMSRYAGVIRDAAGLNQLLQVITDADAVPGVLELEAVEAANLRTVSLLIAAGALRRAESRGCHRRRDAAETAAAPWHTLARWDGEELVVTEEAL